MTKHNSSKGNGFRTIGATDAEVRQTLLLLLILRLAAVAVAAQIEEGVPERSVKRRAAVRDEQGKEVTSISIRK